MDNKGYKKLRVYNEAHQLVKEIYLITQHFPKSETFGLVSQMRRAAVSVVANTLEGQARTSKKEFAYFLSVANGSLVELEYYVELSFELQFFNREEYQQLESKRRSTGNLLGALIKSIKRT